jgi:hypothetical protein
MRGHLAGARAAVFCAAVLAGLVFVGSAFGVTILDFSPHSGLPAKDNGEACPGGTIQIDGTGFVNDGAIGGGAVQVGVPTNTVKVLFNTTPSTYVIVGSNTVMYAVVPDGATDGPLTVQTGAGSASTATITTDPNGTTFYVNPCPQVSLKVAQGNTSVAQGVGSTPSIYKLKPYSGKVGTAVTITGTNLLGVTGVLFGQVNAKFTIVSPTSITTTVPKGAKTGRVVLQYTIGASKSQAGNGLTSGASILTPSNVPSNSGAKAAYQYSARNFVVTH